MKIAVMGAGALGGYFGGRLAAAGADISFIARSAHLEALRSTGLKIESPLGDLHLPKVNATSDPADVGPVDMVLFLVKVMQICSFLILVRWSLPRFRYDQLLRFAWKFMLPFALANLVATVVVVWAIRGGTA